MSKIGVRRVYVGKGTMRMAKGGYDSREEVRVREALKEDEEDTRQKWVNQGGVEERLFLDLK